MGTSVILKELLIYTANGKVFKFSNVYKIMPSSQGFTFNYKGVATGKDREATFNHASVAGYALKDM